MIAARVQRADLWVRLRRWLEAGYQEIQYPPARYRIIDREAPCELLGTTDGNLAALQNEWIDARLACGRADREPHWSEAVAVGRRSFVEQVQKELGPRALYRQVEDVDGTSILRDPEASYGPDSGGEIAALSQISGLNSEEF